jgi:hypothetical protein
LFTAQALMVRSAATPRVSNHGHTTAAHHALLRKLRELPCHGAIDLAPERHHEIGDAIKAFPSPLIEFRRLAIALTQWIDLLVEAGEA